MTLTVWVNGRLAGKHEGGYTPFRVDVTELLSGTGKDVLVVRAEDDPLDLTKPRGKQDWQLEPHAIWYPRTTGIWQTVWMERVSATHLRYVRWTPVVERWEIGFETRMEGRRRKDLRLHVRLEAHDKVLSDDVYSVQSEEVHRRIALSDPATRAGLVFVDPPFPCFERERGNLARLLRRLADAPAIADGATIVWRMPEEAAEIAAPPGLVEVDRRAAGKSLFLIYRKQTSQA